MVWISAGVTRASASASPSDWLTCPGLLSLMIQRTRGWVAVASANGQPRILVSIIRCQMPPSSGRTRPPKPDVVFLE